jgi:hypothetical protein
VKNSAIVFNPSDCCQFGGGIDNLGGSLTIISSTIAKNTAGQGGGGGVFNGGGFVSITNTTIRENTTVNGGSGGGISNINIRNDGGIVQLQNTIVAGNTVSDTGFVPGHGPDCSGTITSLGNNLIGDATDCDVNLQPSDLTGDPGLGPLVGTGDDDLPGEAHYPVLAGSPVIDAGNRHACPKTDQLGNHRNGICDIGSIEFQKEKPSY